MTCPVGASICKTHDTNDKHNKVLTDCVCMHEHKDKYNVSNNNLSKLSISSTSTWFVFGCMLGFCEVIDHKFLTPGHTYLPSDRDFALLRRRKSE